MGKKALIGLIVLLVILAGGYYGLGYYIFDQLSKIEPECNIWWMETKRDNTPAQFVKQFKLEDPIEEVPDLWMASYDDVTFQSREDAVELAGWFIPAPEENDRVVIVVHGFNGCKQDSTQLLPASILHHNGFNVLMIDLRNHGQSEVVNGRMSAGNTEYNDALGAFDYLQAQGYEADNIGLLGISLGAATSAIAFGEEPEMPALWLDSPFGDIADVLDFAIGNAGLPAALVRPGALQVAGFNGVDFTTRTPVTSIQNHNERPIYIVHGSGDTQVPFESGQSVYENAGPNATFLEFEGLEHVEAVYAEPDSYETELVAFFTANLGGDG